MIKYYDEVVLPGLAVFGFSFMTYGVFAVAWMVG